MKKISVTAAAVSLAAVLLLGGCADKGEVSDSDTGLSSGETDNVSYSMSDTQSETNSCESSESSFAESSDVSAVPVPVKFTDEDMELREILSELIEPAEEIYSWMTSLCLWGNTDYKFRFADLDETRIYNYYSFSGTETDHAYYLFERPATVEETEELMLGYFSADRTEKFLNRFAVCSAAENSDGTYTLTLQDGDASLLPAKLIEIDGKMYRDEGVGAVGIFIDLNTVKVTSETDDTIEFTYLDNALHYREEDNAACLNDTALYSRYSRSGTLKYERDGWKLDTWWDVR